VPATDRLQRTFEGCRKEGRSALITYVMGGDPDARTSLAMARACLQGGADILEIGFPFSDPIADGPVIQRAAERALASGTTLDACLELAADVRRQSEAPMVLMGYLNPVLAYGPARFARACVKAGVDGVIVPDLPPDEATEWLALAHESGLSTVFLLAPTSTAARQRAVLDRATGFVYYVSVTGVTGTRKRLPADVAERLDTLRAQAKVPVVVGFGVSTPAQAKTLAPHADGVVVGSAIVARIAESGSLPERKQRVGHFVAGLRAALVR
jgi:tryptophan synthase alpha chain